MPYKMSYKICQPPPPLLPLFPPPVWDLGGQTSIRPYWRCYYPNTDAIIFVVDSADTERLSIAKQELSAMLQEEELASSILLVFANKQDQKGALNAQQISEGMGLPGIRDRQVRGQEKRRYTAAISPTTITNNLPTRRFAPRRSGPYRRHRRLRVRDCSRVSTGSLLASRVARRVKSGAKPTRRTRQRRTG